MKLKHFTQEFQILEESILKVLIKRRKKNCDYVQWWMLTSGDHLYTHTHVYTQISSCCKSETNIKL